MTGTVETVAEKGRRLIDQAGPTMPMYDAGLVVFGCAGRNTCYALAARGRFEEAGVRLLRNGSRMRAVTADVRKALGLPATPGGDG